jgi:predicted aldo/keto reductase-like oxidoreductase
MKNQTVDRREFIGRSAAVLGATLLTRSGAAAAAPPAAATDLVPLGKTGVNICRLGFGTGSTSGSVQRGLTQEGFSRLIRYAYDHGVTYIDTADNYRTHQMIAKAIKGLPRERLFIQTKMPWHKPPFTETPLQEIDRYRQELGVEYIDSLLIHCATRPTWPDDLKRMMDGFSEAKERKLIRLKGVSCHGLPALTRATQEDWVDVHLARVNPQAHHMDGVDGTFNEPGNFAAATAQIRDMHRKGRGVIGMKMIGNGDFTNPQDREKAIRYAMTCGFVDAIVIGFASPAEIDEAMVRMNAALRS